MGIKGAGIMGCSIDATNMKLDTLREYVRMVAQDYVNCLFIFGEGGIGKTETILRTLEEEKIRAVYLNGVVTPLELYNMLYEHNGQLIVFDDIEGVLDNHRAVSFLKAATYGYKDKRVLCYPTNSHLLRAPESFEFTGRIILCMNRFPSNPDLESLYKRTIHFELKLKLDEKISLFRQIAEIKYDGMTLDERKEVCEFLISRICIATKDVCLRDLFRSFNIFKYNKNDWQRLIELLIETDSDVDAYLRVIKTGGSISRQVRSFIDMTGKSRRTFYRIKKKLRDI
jgi:hypothetical protein